MASPELLETLKNKYKRGWYRKGKIYRFLYALDFSGMLVYKTKTAMLKNSTSSTGINPEFDNWFDKAEYIGLEIPEEF